MVILLIYMLLHPSSSFLIQSHSCNLSKQNLFLFNLAIIWKDVMVALCDVYFQSYTAKIAWLPLLFDYYQKLDLNGTSNKSLISLDLHLNPCILFLSVHKCFWKGDLILSASTCLNEGFNNSSHVRVCICFP